LIKVVNVCVFCHRFIIGKEEIPTHSTQAEPVGTWPPERPAAIETEHSEAPAERPSSRTEKMIAYTRELLESM